MPDDCRIPYDDPAHPTYSARQRERERDESDDEWFEQLDDLRREREEKEGDS